MTAKQEKTKIENAFNSGMISKEECDKLLEDITPLLWDEMVFNRGEVKWTHM